MRNTTKIICFLSGLLLAISCNEKPGHLNQLNELPPIYPDYTEVTIPCEIAPLNFTLRGETDRIYAVIRGENGHTVEVGGATKINIPAKQWRSLLNANKGKKLQVSVMSKQKGGWVAYKPFAIRVSPYPIDYGLCYRLIAPGYEAYSKMGIYQRSLSDFRQTALIENTLIPGSCINCHSFKQTDPLNMSLHIRGKHGGTLLRQGDRCEMLSLQTEALVSAGVYPYWHPSGKYIAYSVNQTQQAFHTHPHERVEVFDHASDVIVYDIEANRILTSPLLSTANFETFPSFSPDGKTLYFCCAEQRKLLEEYNEIRYNLCSIPFDFQTGAFGERIDTLIHADAIQKSVSIPRPSYDGKYILYGLADYGSFFIWHNEADLWLLDLASGAQRPLTEVNSPFAESYSSWSSNSHWFVFTSRREDGLYTRLYLSSIDDEGAVSKPFLLPQANPTVIDHSLYSFNVPEFVSSPVKLAINKIEREIFSGERKQAAMR